MTCKDCIHYCICKDTWADENWSDEAPIEIKEMYSPKGCENFVAAADLAPVKHGEWTHTGYCDGWECSVCKSQLYLSDDEAGHPDYCPQCGSRMDGIKESV